MTNLPPVVKITSSKDYLPDIIKVDGKVFKVKE